MATVSIFRKMEADQVVLHGVSWETYCRLNDEDRNDPIRMTYLDGDLTLISAIYRNDRPTEQLSQLIRGVTAGLGLEIMSVGSTTLRRAVASGQCQGAAKEPDAAFYLGANERRMRMREELDLSVDPPPDLAIEVEYTEDLTALALAVYARLGVPEVWRFRMAGGSVSINRLGDAGYKEVTQSAVYPKLTPARIAEALDRYQVGDFDDNAWFEWMKVWAQTLPGPDNTV